MKMTPGLRFLKQHEIPHEAREYDHRAKGAAYAAEALDWPLPAMAKTLVAALADAGYCQCLLPGDAELSVKKLARAAGARSARMSTPEEAEKLTGYQVGGISPFGVRRPVPVWVHQSLLAFDTIGVNGGRRGLIVFLAPGALVAACGARVADLAA